MAKRKRRPLFITLCILLAIVIGIAGFIILRDIKTEPTYNDSATQSGEENEALTRICKDLDIDAEIVAAESKGDILKLEYQKAGLDTYKMSVVLYSLEKRKVISKKDFGDGAFYTGMLNDGFYVAEQTKKQIQIYDNNCNLIDTINIPCNNPVGFLAMSGDRKHVCYNDIRDLKIYVYDTATKKSTAICNFSTSLRFIETDGSVFYLQSDTNTMITIDAQKGTEKTVDYGSEQRLNFTSRYCYVPSDDPIDNESADSIIKHVKIERVDEIEMASSKSRLLTVTNQQDNDVIAIYDFIKSQRISIKIKNRVFAASILNDDYVFVCVSKQYGDKPSLYLIETSKLKDVKNFADNESPTPNKENIADDSELKKAKIIKNVPTIAQYPQFPTGCESVSAVIAMRYAGENIKVDVFIDRYLDKSDDFSFSGGVKYGPDPYEYFIGSPRSSSGYGCMSPVIEKALKKYYKDNSDIVLNETGKSFSYLCDTYIDNNIPVIVWTSIEMVEPYYSNTWTLPSGNKFTWLSKEHCMVLIGYDENNYYFSDPFSGEHVKFSKSLSEKRYTAFGKQALVINKK